MISNRQIIADKNYFSVMESLTQTYTEIASARAQKIRRSVLINRDFLQEITAIYQEIKTNYKEVLKKIQSTEIKKKNGKVALVLITTNSGLYGDLNSKIFNYFSAWVDRYPPETELFVLGNKGKLFFEDRYPGRTYQMLPFSDDSFDKNQFQNLSASLVNYSEVLVFYGQFKSLANQEATMNSLTGSTGQTAPRQDKIYYLFEPSMGSIVNFFETEIFTSIFLQTIYESLLAKYAARIDSLDQSSEKIKQKIKLLIVATQSLRHQRLNRNQLEITTAQLLWKKLT